MPIPLAMMIPFMATQSLVMGEAFGKAFQFGKRKISAMSNEEFNKLEIEQVASEMFESYKNIDMSLRESIEKSQDLQEFIVQQMLLIVPKMIESLLNKGAEVIGPVVQPAPAPPPSGGVVTTPGDLDTSDVFETKIRHNETRNVWVGIITQTDTRPTDAAVYSKAKQDLYLGSAPAMQKTLVVDKMLINHRPSKSVLINSKITWYYQVQMDFHWFTTQ